MRSLSLLIASMMLALFEVADARTLLETTHGKCIRELITAQTTTGMADVAQGQSRECHVPSNRFWWNCGKEQKNGPYAQKARHWLLLPELPRRVILAGRATASKWFPIDA